MNEVLDWPFMSANENEAMVSNGGAVAVDSRRREPPVFFGESPGGEQQAHHTTQLNRAATSTRCCPVAARCNYVQVARIPLAAVVLGTQSGGSRRLTPPAWGCRPFGTKKMVERSVCTPRR